MAKPTPKQKITPLDELKPDAPKPRLNRKQIVERFQEICDAMQCGENLRSISILLNFDYGTFLNAVDESEERIKLYARARERMMEYWSDEIDQIAADGTHDTITISKNGQEYEVCNHEWIARSRLMVDTRKWLMSKLSPRKYGDKIEQTHKGEVTTNVYVWGEDPAKAKPPQQP